VTNTSAPDKALVLAAIEQVWGSMLFATAEPWPADMPADFGSGVQAQIELRGDWNGRLVLTCDSDVAAQIAGAMLGCGPEEVLPALDVHDAVGEILNVVGGSVKGALESVSALGLPGVIQIAAPPAPDDCLVVRWRDAPVYVQVVQDADAA
jgi:chemotaxis protein CheX